MPIARPDAAARRATLDAYGRVVLLRAVDVVRKIVIDRDAIKLCGGLILFGPASPAVESDVGAAVVALDHAVRIVRSDPQIVIIAVRHLNRAVRAPAVIRAKELNIQNVDGIG